MAKKAAPKMPGEHSQVGRTGLSRRVLLQGASLILATPALVGNLQAQQFPIPQTAAEVPGPAPGPMTKASVQMVGRMAYVWGWPLVYVYNQRTELTKAPEKVLLDGAIPVGPMNQVVMLTNYISPSETYMDIPNQDVVYGMAWLSLAKEPLVVQVPDFGDRFWTFPVYDARTDEIQRARVAIRDQARVLHDRGAELERRKRPPALPAWCARPPTSPH